MRGLVDMKNIVISFVLLLAAAGVATAAGSETTVTPYGDYCRNCAAYGYCKNMISLGESMTALDHYYRVKGYTLGAVRQKGRFIEVDVFKDDRPVDRVLFDRKTGRIRSIY